VGRDVNLNLSANDVIHAFWVPEFRLKQDAIPGRQSRLRFTPSRIGTYPVICAELCGAYHGAMKTKVIVQTPEEYNAWLQSQRVAMATVAAPVPASPTPADRLNQHAASLGLPTQLVATLDQSSPPGVVEHSHSH
jgi:cytochrome c oxidase subunit 2